MPNAATCDVAPREATTFAAPLPSLHAANNNPANEIASNGKGVRKDRMSGYDIGRLTEAFDGSHFTGNGEAL
ncbi:hypothetical protein LBMAG49_24510 [Planctomycetota bacterium]|nr:hypothetical protein LBMAG49_24510 [Planctomycetota bacterium]